MNKSKILPYRVLDSGNRMKLEQAGPYRLIRPALNAAWQPSLPQKEWDAADGIFERNSSGSGRWTWKITPPTSWLVQYSNFNLMLKPTNFGHLGFFAEQYVNWEYFQQIIPKLGDQPATLNLFGYSGVGSMAMAAAGAKCCHLDAAKGMIDWGKENLNYNPHVPNNIRWMVDDVRKFCARELRRGNRYQGIALDPPSFGRGDKGQVWKIDEDLPKLLEQCRELLDLNKPCFLVLSGHSPGFTPLSQGRLLAEYFPEGEIENFEMTIQEPNNVLPAGICSRVFLRGKK